jgi:hypothetical protein
VTLAQQAQQDQPELQDPLAQPELRVTQAQQDQPAQLVMLAQQDPPVLRVRQDRPDQPDPQARRETLDQPDHKVFKVSKVFKVIQDPQAQPERLAAQARPDRQVAAQPDQQAQQALSLPYLVLPAQQVPLAAAVR